MYTGCPNKMVTPLLLIGVTDFNQINSILKLRSYSTQPMECHVPLILNKYKNNLPKSINILLGQPVVLKWCIEIIFGII